MLLRHVGGLGSWLPQPVAANAPVIPLPVIAGDSRARSS